jgi:flagellar hook-associated protein 3 FlgL
MMNTQLLRNLNNNMRQMDNLQMQMSTGRRINKPSDDPVGISFSMRYRSELKTIDQYTANSDAAESWLSYSDTVVGQTGDIVAKLRDLAVQAANGTNSQAALDAMKEQVDQLYKQTVEVANNQFNGKYVFNGQMTNIQPYTEADAMNEMTDDGEINFEIGAGSKISVNVSGNKVFGFSTDDDNLFKVAKDFSTALANGDGVAISDVIAKLDTRMNHVLDARSDIGARQNRVELASDRLKDTSINLQSLQSKTEDADMAVVITNMKTNQNVYEASLSAGSKLIQPSLLDFLR